MKNLVYSFLMMSCCVLVTDNADACRRNRCCQQASCGEQTSCCQQRPRIFRRSNNCCEQTSSSCDSGVAQSSSVAAPAMSYEAAPMESYGVPTPAVSTEPMMYQEGASDCGCGGGVIQSGEVVQGGEVIQGGEPMPMETYSEGAVVEGGETIIESAPYESSPAVEAPVETAIPDAPVEG